MLVVAFSSGLSATCHSAQIAAQELSEQYPERKVYVVDSLCASLYLSHEYYEVTKDKSIFTEEFRLMVQAIVDTFTTEQRHDRSPYWFIRENCPKSDTLPMGGHGRPVNTTGMTWSASAPRTTPASSGI